MLWGYGKLWGSASCDVRFSTSLQPVKNLHVCACITALLFIFTVYVLLYSCTLVLLCSDTAWPVAYTSKQSSLSELWLWWYRRSSQCSARICCSQSWDWILSGLHIILSVVAAVLPKHCGTDCGGSRTVEADLCLYICVCVSVCTITYKLLCHLVDICALMNSQRG